MLTFITLFISAVILLVCAYLIDKHAGYDFEWLAGALLACGIFTCIALIITFLSLINIGTRFEATQNEYKVVSEMVESYDGQDYGNMTALTESVVSINSTIAKHKAHYKSKWTGPWFSEDIANLEPITFSKIIKLNKNLFRIFVLLNRKSNI